MAKPPSTLVLDTTTKDSLVAKSHRKDLPFMNPTALVTLVAVNGGDEKNFVVHKEFAYHYSPVFRAAFNSEFAEGKTGIYRLTEASESAVQLLVQWLYHQEFEIKMLERKKYVAAEELALIQLWILADQLMISQLQNLTSDKIWKSHYSCKNIHDTPPPFDYIYQNTIVGSPLRLLFVHHKALQFVDHWFAKDKEHIPKDMLLEIIFFYSQSSTFLCKKLGIWDVTRLSRYHVPGDKQSKESGDDLDE